MPLITVAVVAALALGGSAAVAAQDSLPGQPLYPIKVQVDENVEGAFALTDMARASWDMSLLGERITEAQLLAQSGNLSASAQNAITDNFDMHLYDVGSLINKLQADGDTADAADIALRLKTSLSVRQQLLASTSAQVASESQQSLIPIVADVEGALGAATVLSSSTEVHASSSQK